MQQSNQLSVPRHPAPCFVVQGLGVGGSQVATLRYLVLLPEWVRERATVWVPDSSPQTWPLTESLPGDLQRKITGQMPAAPRRWVMSNGEVRAGMHEACDRFAIIVHAQWPFDRSFLERAYSAIPGSPVAYVSFASAASHAAWERENRMHNVGILLNPIAETSLAQPPARGKPHIDVAFMSRPARDKGILVLPEIVALDNRIRLHVFSGVNPGYDAKTQRWQAQPLGQCVQACEPYGDRVVFHPFHPDAFHYASRLAGIDCLVQPSRAEGSCLAVTEALSCGVPVAASNVGGIAEQVSEGVNGALFEWNDDPRKCALAAMDAIHRAVKLSTERCRQSVAHRTPPQYDAKVLCELCGCGLNPPQAPRVTIGVRFHEGGTESWLDQCMASIASQSYRRFRTLLLVDGSETLASRLGKRYGVEYRCNGAPANRANTGGLHNLGLTRCDTEFYKPLDFDDCLTSDYLDRAISGMDATGVDHWSCRMALMDADGNVTCDYHPWPRHPVATMFTAYAPLSNQIAHPATLVRTDSARMVGGYREVCGGPGEDDYDVWYRMHAMGMTFHRDDTFVGVLYRKHSRQTGAARARDWTTGAVGCALPLSPPPATVAAPRRPARRPLPRPRRRIA